MSQKVDLNTYNNEWYKPGVYHKRILWYFTSIFFFKNYMFSVNPLKVFMLKLFGANVGKGVVVKPGVIIKYPWKLFVGNNVWIGENVWIDNLANVTLHNNVCVSQGAMLLTGNHNYKKTSFDLIIGEITLNEGVWVGAKAVVCPGVTCESHAVLGVNAVANKDLKAFSIYSGNPAVFQKQRIIEE